MDILGIGPMELILVLVLVLLIFGPEDLVKTGKKLGRFFNQIVKSEGWMAVRSVTREIRGLPNRLAREAELEDLSKDLKNQTIAPPPTQKPASTPASTQTTTDSEKLKAWTSPPEKVDPVEGANPTTEAQQEDAHESAAD